jgi:predicted transcriptional regulator
MPDKQRENRAKVGHKLPPVETRWKPGQSGNPKGRPKSITLSEAYRKMLSQVDETDPERRTRAEVLAEQMYIKASSGDVSALREIADRVEGKARQTIALSVEKREQLEQAISGIMRDAEHAGEPCTREEAIATLSMFRPEVSDLLN